MRKGRSGVVCNIVIAALLYHTQEPTSRFAGVLPQWEDSEKLPAVCLFLILPLWEDPVTEERGNKEVGLTFDNSSHRLYTVLVRIVQLEETHLALELQLVTGNSTPLYRQIIEQVRMAVATGALAPGEQLPSVRAVAERLVINPNTVARAYADLTRDGVIESQPGKGLYVAERRMLLSDEERVRRLAVGSGRVYPGGLVPRLPACGNLGRSGTAITGDGKLGKPGGAGVAWLTT